MQYLIVTAFTPLFLTSLKPEKREAHNLLYIFRDGRTQKIRIFQCNAAQNRVWDWCQDHHHTLIAALPGEIEFQTDIVGLNWEEDFTSPKRMRHGELLGKPPIDPEDDGDVRDKIPGIHPKWEKKITQPDVTNRRPRLIRIDLLGSASPRAETDSWMATVVRQHGYVPVFTEGVTTYYAPANDLGDWEPLPSQEDEPPETPPGQD